jgi:hypothetical protein
VTARLAICICPTCEERQLVVRYNPAHPRCRTCAWLLSLLPEEKQPSVGFEDKSNLTDDDDDQAHGAN